MLIEQIDGVDLEPFQRALDALFNVLRPAVQTDWMRIFLGVIWNPNLVAITTWSRIGARASPTSSSFRTGHRLRPCRRT